MALATRHHRDTCVLAPRCQSDALWRPSTWPARWTRWATRPPPARAAHRRALAPARSPPRQRLPRPRRFAPWSGSSPLPPARAPLPPPGTIRRWREVRHHRARRPVLVAKGELPHPPAEPQTARIARMVMRLFRTAASSFSEPSPGSACRPPLIADRGGHCARGRVQFASSAAQLGASARQQGRLEARHLASPSLAWRHGRSGCGSG